jgi:spermidine/putrescine transport system ATP-binding protein
MSDRIVVMSQGRIEQSGTPQDLYYRPRTQFVASFFGDNNLIEGVVGAGGRHVETVVGPLPIANLKEATAAGRKVLVTVRPESLRIGDGLIAISADVEEVMFGGALTRVLLRATAAPDVKFDIRLPGDGRGNAPSAGDRVTVTYDPADAVIVAA